MQNVKSTGKKLFKWDFYQLNNATSPSTMAMMQMMHMHTYIHGRIFPAETYQVLWALTEIPFAQDLCSCIWRRNRCTLDINPADLRLGTMTT